MSIYNLVLLNVCHFHHHLQMTKNSRKWFFITSYLVTMLKKLIKKVEVWVSIQHQIFTFCQGHTTRNFGVVTQTLNSSSIRYHKTYDWPTPLCHIISWMYWPFFNMRSNFLIGHCFTCPDQNFLPLTWEYDYAKTPSQIGIDHTKSSGITTPWYLVPLAHDPHYYPENCRISTHWIFIWEMDRKIWVGSNHLSFTSRLLCHAKTLVWILKKTYLL